MKKKINSKLVYKHSILMGGESNDRSIEVLGKGGEAFINNIFELS